MDWGGAIRLAVFGHRNDNASIVTAEERFPAISIFIDAPNCKWLSSPSVFVFALRQGGGKKGKRKPSFVQADPCINHYSSEEH